MRYVKVSHGVFTKLLRLLSRQQRLPRFHAAMFQIHKSVIAVKSELLSKAARTKAAVGNRTEMPVSHGAISQHNNIPLF